MQAIRTIFNGHDIKLIEPIKTHERTEVLVIFPDEEAKYSAAEAMKLLRGSGRGEGLTEKLLKSRKEDIQLDRK